MTVDQRASRDINCQGGRLPLSTAWGPATDPISGLAEVERLVSGAAEINLDLSEWRCQFAGAIQTSDQLLRCVLTGSDEFLQLRVSRRVMVIR